MNRRDFLTGIFGIVCARLLRGWHKPPVSSEPQCGEIVAIDYVDGDRLVMIAECGDGVQHILYSDDWGHTFYTVGGPSCGAKMNTICAASYQWWFIGCSNGELWETRDAGASWEREEYNVIGGLSKGMNYASAR